jgi:glycosyltransferase involved in cell wall biosynthesis
LLEEVKKKAPANVTVVGWADAATFWSAVDCAISTSNNEGVPVALIEAQLAGIPVIATDVGSNSEVIENLFIGIVTSKNPMEIAETISNLMANKFLMDSLAREASRRAKSKFDLEKMVREHATAYSDLIK